MNAIRINLHGVRLILAIVLATAISACRAPQPALKPLDLDGSKPIAAVAQELGDAINGASKTTLRLSPELVASAKAFVKMAPLANGSDEQKRLLLLADTCARNANAVASTLASPRTLHFPAERSLGKVSSAKDGKTWREIGLAQGTLELEPEYVLMVNLDESASDNDLALLAALPPGAFQYLVISSREISKQGFEYLTQIVGLRQLSLYGTTYDDSVLPIIAQCYGLNHVNLMGTKVTDNGMESLKLLPALREIGVGDTAVGDRGLFVISQFPAIESVILRNNTVTDVGVDYLRRAATLSRLWLSGPMITDQSVPLLSELKNLRELALLNTHVSERAIRSLQKALPECKVEVVF